jgi:hypothetical protein
MDHELRRDLLARFEADQDALSSLYEAADIFRDDFCRSQTPSGTPWPFAILEWEPEDQAPALVIEALLHVRANTRFLRQLVEDSGWPGRDRVGEDGADAAWVLLQHAGAGVRTLDSAANRYFRHMCVPLLERAVADGLAHPRHLAHTVDGIQSVEGEPPVYAVLSTAFVSDEDGPQLAPGLDVTTINQHRHRIGLAPVSEDLRLRALGREPAAVGGEQPEPWTDIRDHSR